MNLRRLLQLILLHQYSFPFFAATQCTAVMLLFSGGVDPDGSQNLKERGRSGYELHSNKDSSRSRSWGGSSHRPQCFRHPFPSKTHSLLLSPEQQKQNKTKRLTRALKKSTSSTCWKYTSMSLCFAGYVFISGSCPH